MSHQRENLEQNKLYSLKPRNTTNASLNYFDNSILFKKHRSRSRARHSNVHHDDDLNWLLANKQNDFELLKDLLYSSFINETSRGSSRPRRREKLSSTSSSTSSDMDYYKNRPIEFLDENVFFDEVQDKNEARQANTTQDLVEIHTPDEIEPATIESLIEEIDAELKKSLESSLSSSPLVNSARFGNVSNKCTCQIMCVCQCHSSPLDAKSNRFRFGSNSSSITSSRNSSSLLLQSNSPSIRRVSYESLEWDVSLDNQINSSSRLSK